MSEDKINLWHYTNLEGLKGILDSQSLWATHYQFLNDSSELIYSKSILQKELFPRIAANVEQEYKKNVDFKQEVDLYKGIESFARQATVITTDILYETLLNLPFNYPPFVLSFCMPKENEDFLQKNGRLSQWRGYGKDGGYAVILNREKLMDEFKTEQSNYYYGISSGGQVVYDLKELSQGHRLIKYLENIKNYAYRVYRYGIHEENLNPATKDEISNFVDCVMFLKHKGFSEEEEFRLYGMPFKEEAKDKVDLEKTEGVRDFKKIMHRTNSGAIVPFINFFE